MSFTSYTNPYMAGDPVGKQPSFVGREDVLRDVLRVLRHPQQNAITLYGQRRIGKTSILQYLEAHLPEEGAYLPVYFDLMNFSGKPLDALLRELANTIAGALQREQPDLGKKPQQAFQETWLPTLLESLSEGARLVVLMDEFDVQADPDADKQLKQAFFGYMRKLRRLAPARLKFVFVLGRTIDDLDIIAQGLFKDLPSRRVSLLKREDAERLIRLSERQDGLRWTEAAVERIWDLTHGQPYLIQALCNETWERAYEESDAPPPVTAEQVDEAVPDAMERSENVFTWLWEGLGPAEKVVAAALAEAGPTIVGEEQLRHILSESGVRIVIRELQDAPKLLQDWDILEPADGGYRVRVELLRRWIAEHKPLSRVQSELDRVHPAADGFYQAGRNLYLNGDIPRATNSLQQALELNPNHQGALELLGEIQLAQGDLDAAQETLERLLALSPARARARLKQIYLKRAESTEDEEEQLAWYEKILAFYPQDADALKGKQEIERRRRQRQIQEAKDEIARLETGQQFAAALEKAQALQRQFPEEEDLSALTREIEQHSKAWRIQNALDEILQLEQEQQFTTALEKAQTLQQEFPQEKPIAEIVHRLKRKTRLEGLYQEALTALEKGATEVAIQNLQEIIALEPAYREGKAVTHLYKAITGEDIPEMKAALENLRQALEEQQATAAQEKKDLQSKIKALQKKVKNLQQALEKQEAATAQEENQRASLLKEKENLQTEIQALQEKITLLQQNSSQHLSVWNPLDYLRLLWWLLVTPSRLKVYKEQWGEETVEAVGNRLAYTLTFLPLFLPPLGLGLGLLPRTAEAWSQPAYFWLAVGIGGLWFLFYALTDDWKLVAAVVAGIVADLVALVVAGVVALGVALVVASSMTGGVALGVAGSVEDFVAGSVEDFVAGSAANFVAVGAAGSVAGGVALGMVVRAMGISVASGVAGVVAGVVASLVGSGAAFGVGYLIDNNVENVHPSLWALVLLVLSLGTLTFLSLGELAWLQSGAWPAPVWPFGG